MGITDEGIMGEKMLFMLLEEWGYKFFQPDSIGEKDGKFNVFEAKHQARFKKPPFDGHGLPLWQIRARLNFEQRTGIGTILVIFDSETGETFYQELKKLDEGEHFDTQGDKPRRIYPITNFNVFNMEQTA